MSAFIRYYALPMGALSAFACQAIVDEYSIDDDTSVGADGDSDTDSDSNSNGDPDALIECGKFVTPPRGDDIEFCTIARTAFYIGCDDALDECKEDELPKHQTALSSFKMSVNETTVDSYRNFILDRPEWAPEGSSAAAQCDTSYLDKWTDAVPPAGTLDFPVVWVCWYAAKAFCEWLGAGFRLPTEAEWETAARGAHDGEDERDYWVYPFEGTYSCAKANYLGCYHDAIDVGTLTGVSFGHLYDMAGNAWEWVSDWYRADYYCDPLDEGLYAAPKCNDDYAWSDPKGPNSGTEKILRGGSWYHDSLLVRTAERGVLTPETSTNLTGFRCAGD